MFPVRYLPNSLNRNDRKKQKTMLLKSRNMYKKGKYYTRKSLSSAKTKPSNHVSNARKMYNIHSVTPTKELVFKTGCTLSTLKKIVNKGEGAYYSSGSRPNQTPQSWGLARLASSITGGNAAAVDFDLLEKGCDHSKRAFRLANQLKNGRTRKNSIKQKQTKEAKYGNGKSVSQNRR